MNSNQNGARPGSRLSWLTVAAYGLPSLGLSLVFVPLNSVVPGIYAKYFGLPLTFIGISRLILMVFDGFSDIATAYCSDLTRTRWGSRKPWIVAGVFVTALGAYLVYMPPTTSLAGAPWYYLSGSGLVYLGWTMISVPYTAWGAEISSDYQERSRLATYKGGFDAGGTILSLAVPIIFGFKTEEMTPEVMWIIGVGTIVMLPLFCFLSVALIPTTPTIGTSDARVLEIVRSIRGNKPFQIFLAAFLLQGLALGIFAALIFLFIDVSLGLGDRYARILIGTVVAGFLSLPLWLRLTNRWGKHVAWGVGSLVTNLVLALLVFVPHGERGYIPVLVIMIVYGITGQVASITLYSMLADIVDYDILRTRTNRTAVYFAFLTLAVKVTAGVGSFIALGLLDVVGFNAQAGTTNTPAAQTGMLWVFFGLHTLLQLAALPFIWLSPIDKRRQAIIRKRIEQRAEREARRDPGRGMGEALYFAPQ